jgi:hypothetical protein
MPQHPGKQVTSKGNPKKSPKGKGKGGGGKGRIPVLSKILGGKI